MTLPFSVIFVVVIIPALILLLAIGGMIQRKRAEEKLFRTGVIYLKGLRSLLMFIQQHRGLTNSFLNGNAAVAHEVKKLEVLIERDIQDVSSIAGWLQQNAKWDNILDHWSRMTGNYAKLDAEANLKQHNILIANVLYLIDDVAYAHHLGKLGLVDTADTDWRNLLFIAEYIGQARALGMGAVSKGHCSSVLRIQLNHLHGKIESNINRSWSEATREDFRLFLHTIEQQVVVDKPTIAPNEYFRLATGCIEHVLKEFDRQVESLSFVAYHKH